MANFFIGLTRRQRNQSPVAIVGDPDNSLSMRWVKSDARSSMNHVAGFGSGWPLSSHWLDPQH